MAYELLAGHLSFQGETPGALIAAIMSGRHTRLTDMQGHIPRELAELVERCLATDPGSRFQSGGEPARALRDLSAGKDSPSRTTREQEIKYCTTSDGASIAYSVVGAGPVIVRVPGHFTHLEMEWEWPDLRRFWEQLAERFTMVRYDGRGIGLSNAYTGDFTEETRQLDLDAILDATGAENVALAVRADEGRLLASIVPGAQLVLLPSGTHYFPADMQVVPKVVGAITKFIHGS